jgi:hypothetical protein
MDAAPIVLSSTDSSDDGQDARAVLTSTTASKAEALKATARKRKRPDTSPLLKGLFAREYSSVEAIKDQLREWNPKCFPRVRSVSGLEGRNVRFSCKNEKVDEPISTPENQIKVTVQPYFGSEKLYLDSIFTFSDGNQIKFTDIKFYFSEGIFENNCCEKRCH